MSAYMIPLICPSCEGDMEHCGWGVSGVDYVCSKCRHHVRIGHTIPEPGKCVVPLDYAQIIQSLAFLTDEQRAGFFALLAASYCLTCGSLADQCRCESDVPPPWSVYPAGRVE